MELKSHVAIVSIFGRGNWLAVELARMGIIVALVDVSESVGKWAPEDWEGPFGFFKPTGFSQSQNERFLEDDVYQIQPNGLTLWTKEGPFEFRGPLASHHLARHQIREKIVKYIQGEESKLELQDYSKDWLAHFSHQFSSAAFALNASTLRYGFPIPLFENFGLREVSRQGAAKNLEWLRRNNVQVFDQYEVKDIGFESKKVVDKIQLKLEHTTQLLNTQNLVWCLSSEETEFISPTIQKKLFTPKVMLPEWAWIRYRLRLADHPTREQLPNHFVMIENNFIPWSHENLIVVQRTTSRDLFDFWVKIPNQQRFNKDYLQQIKDKIIAVSEYKLFNLKPELVSFPQEHNYAYSQLGPTRHPVYNMKEKINYKIMNFSNVEFHSPEVWLHNGWQGIFHFEKLIVEEFKNWWAKEQEIVRKRRSRGDNCD